MREIKFRAWDRKKQTMFPVHQMQFEKLTDQLSYISGVDIHDKDSDFHGDVFYGGSVHKMTGNPLQPKFELMQCTGLKDKHGVEIYEGDIVSGKDFSTAMFQHWGADIEDKSELYFIKYDAASFKLFNLQDRWVAVLDHHVMSHAKDLSVIGNIYENPELLSGGDTQ